MSGDLHPDRYGYPIPNDVTTAGRNRNDGTPPESSYVRCKKCGFTMSTQQFPKGRGEGNAQVYTQLNGAVTAGDATITVDSTAGFPTPVVGTASYFYIYDTGSSGTGMNKVQYTGLTATQFTGCTGATAHETDMYARGEPGAGGGCPFCHTYNYD